jgi:hypothetical protein
MTIKDQVCSIDQAFELKAMGLNQNEGNWYWKKFDGGIGLFLQRPTCKTKEEMEQYAAALSVAELGLLLTSERSPIIPYKNGRHWQVANDYASLWVNNSFATEAEARAELLIYLIKDRPWDFRIDKVNARQATYPIRKL